MCLCVRENPLNKFGLVTDQVTQRHGWNGTHNPPHSLILPQTGGWGGGKARGLEAEVKQTAASPRWCDVSAASCEPSAWFTAAADGWQLMSWFSPYFFLFLFRSAAGATSGVKNYASPFVCLKERRFPHTCDYLSTRVPWSWSHRRWSR